MGIDSNYSTIRYLRKSLFGLLGVSILILTIHSDYCKAHGSEFDGRLMGGVCNLHQTCTLNIEHSNLSDGSAPLVGFEKADDSFPLDIALKVRCNEVLPCKGSNVSFDIILKNVGTELFKKSITLKCTVKGCSISADRFSIDRFVDLIPGEADSLIYSFSLSGDCDSAVVDVEAGCSIDDNNSNNSAAFFLCISPGRLLVNEIMYKPESGRSEWLELFNNSQYPINLKGWKIADATGKTKLITSDGLVIEPENFLILCQSTDEFYLQYPDCTCPVITPVGGWPRLNDTPSSSGGGVYADIIELFNEKDILIEAVRYTNLLASSRGISLERVSRNLCSTGALGLWQMSSSVDGATPGAVNSIDTTHLPTLGSVLVVPATFDPRCVKTNITASLLRGETGCSVRIFDMKGDEIGKLLGAFGKDQVFSCFWDGRASNGTIVRTGVYICLVEFIRHGGVVCRRVKKPVIVFSD